MLEVEKVFKRYKDNVVLNNITMSLDNGIYGFLGANGAGKTTLINIIAGVKKPNEGRILYKGEDIMSLGENYRKVLGFLPQKVSLYSTMTARQYIDYLSVLKGIKSKSERDKQIEEHLKQFNLYDIKDKKIATYSGGMKQRLAIAQALIGNPKIVLLDEPTVGLDPEERIRFKNEVNKLSKNARVIISTHILSDLSELADVLCMFKNGNLIYTGKREEWISEDIDGKYMEIMEAVND